MPICLDEPLVHKPLDFLLDTIPRAKVVTMDLMDEPDRMKNPLDTVYGRMASEVECAFQSDCEEHALVMSLDTAFVTMASGEPGFVLRKGATENAVGVKTLQSIIAKTGLKHQVSLEDRPVFRFGDGLSPRACSKLILHGAALGHVELYVLDRDHRPQTHNAENTPALLRFLRRARGMISYERLCLWFREYSLGH